MATATYEPIATTTLGSAAASITFSSIAATWTDLRVVLTCTTSSPGTLYIQFNSDTNSNYSSTEMLGNGSAANSYRYTNSTQIYLNENSTSSTIPGFVTSDIFQYAGSTYKTVLNSNSNDKNGSGEVFRNVGLWRSTAAIASILLVIANFNFNAGTTATLYGIKAA